MKVVIFANGEIQKPESLQAMIADGDFLIAADGGLRHIRQMKKIPDLLVGDLDSISEKDFHWLKKNSIEIQRFSTDKNQTDLELALYAALDRGADAILVAGALGGRTDQTLANINLLLMPELQNLDVRLDDGLEEIFLVQHHAIVTGTAGDLVSLIPMGSLANGIRTKGLKYKLIDETLFVERSRGISNVMKSDRAEVAVRSGILLCVHRRKMKGKEK